VRALVWSPATYHDELIQYLVQQGSNNELLESSKVNLPPPFSNDDDEDAPTDVAKEEEEPPLHVNAASDSKGNLIKVNLNNSYGESNQGAGNGVWHSFTSDPGEDDADPLNESDEESNEELGMKPKRDSDSKESDPSKESEPKEEESTEKSDLGEEEPEEEETTMEPVLKLL